jgi:hypothetical protein
VAGCCEHGDEPFGSTKGGAFADCLSYNQLLNKESAPWRQCSSPNTGKVIRKRMKKRAGHLARMGGNQKRVNNFGGEISKRDETTREIQA